MTELEKKYFDAVNRLPEGITPEEIEEIMVYKNNSKKLEDFYSFLAILVPVTTMVFATKNYEIATNISKDIEISLSTITSLQFMLGKLAPNGDFAKETLAIQNRLYFNEDANTNAEKRIFASPKFQFITKVLSRSTHLENFTNHILSLEEKETIAAKAQKFTFGAMAKWLDKNVIQFKNKVKKKLHLYKNVLYDDKETIAEYFKQERTDKRNLQKNRTEAFIKKEIPPCSQIEKLCSSIEETKTSVEDILKTNKNTQIKTQIV